MRGPHPDAFHLGKMFDDFLIGGSASRSKSSTPAEFARKVFQIGRLLFRKADAAHLRVGKFQNAFRRQRITCKRGKALEDRGSRLAIQLLINNRLGNARKIRRTKLHSTRPNSLDNRTQNWIGFLEMIHGFSHGLYVYHKVALKGEQNTNYILGVVVTSSQRFP